MLYRDVIKVQNKVLETPNFYSSPLFLDKQLLCVSPMLPPGEGNSYKPHQVVVSINYNVCKVL